VTTKTKNEVEICDKAYRFH